MKKIFTAVLLAGVVVANAQENEKPNMVKLNATALALGNIQLGYERVITKRLSIAVNTGILAKGNIPYASSFNLDEDLRNLTIQGNTFTLEPRFYVGKKGYGKGFYVTPYYRYSQYKVDNFKYDMELYPMQKEPIHITGKVRGHSGGLMIGSQWFLGKKKNIVLDAWFIGAHYGVSKGELNGRTERKLNVIEQQEAKKELDNFVDIPLIKYNSNVSENGANIKIDGPWAGIRGGLSIGYKF